MFGQDVDGDGARDLARLPAGTYRYRLGRSTLLGRVLRPEANQLVDRDVFHDGTFRGGRRSSAGKSILFHTGCRRHCRCITHRHRSSHGH